MVDIFGGDGGAQFIVASECDVYEAHKEAIQNLKDIEIRIIIITSDMQGLVWGLS